MEILTNILLYDPDFVRAYVCTHNSEPKVSLKDGGDNHRTYGNEHLIDYDLLLHLTRLNSESSEAVVVGAAEVVKLIVDSVWLLWVIFSLLTFCIANSKITFRQISE